jgi:O-antigen/teichoic acid export membrane protein
LGLYGRADGLVSMFNRIVTAGVAPVAVAAFARQHRAGDQIRSDFLRTITMMTAISWPFFIFLGVMTEPIIRILFGDGWEAAIPITRVLCVAGCVSSIANLNWFVFQGTGAVRKNLSVQLLAQPITIALVVLGANFSLEVVGCAIIVASVTTVGISFYYVNPMIGASGWDVARAASKSLVVALCSAAGPVVVGLSLTIDREHVALPFVLAALGGLAGWALSLWIFDHPLRVEVTIVLATIRRWTSARLDRSS